LFLETSAVTPPKHQRLVPILQTLADVSRPLTRGGIAYFALEDGI